MPSRSVSPGPAAAALGVEHQRHAPVFCQRQHAVDLLVVHVALRAREHGVVIGHDDAARALRAELLAIDGRNAHDEAVGRRVLDEVVELAPAALGRDREAAVLHEGAVVDELRDVLAGGALVGVAAALDRGRPVRIERVGLARDQLGEIRADVVEVDIGFRRRRVGRDVERLQIQDRFAMHQSGAVSGDELHHPAALLGHDEMLHLHGLDHGKLLAGAHDLALLHLDGDDGSLQGCRDHHRAFGHGLRNVRLHAVTAASLSRGEVERLGCAIGRLDQFRDVAIDEIGRDPVGPEIGMREHRLEEGDVGDDAVDPEFAQGARSLGDHVMPGLARRMHDDFREQRIEGRAGLVARIAKTIDTDAGPRRRLEQGEHAAGRMRRASLVQRLHVDAELHGVAARLRDRSLRKVERGQRAACCDRELGADEVEAQHRFRHGVLDLEPRIGLDEGKAILRRAVDQELESTEIVVSRGGRELPRRLDDAAAQGLAQRRARRHLDQLLVPALDGAFALPEMRDRTMTVADDLHLDMTRLADQPLGIDAVEAECRLGLGLAARIGFRQIGRILDHAHAAATAAGHRLDHDRRVAAKRREERRDLLERRRPAGAGDDRHAAAFGQLPCRDLVAKQFERCHLWPDKGDPLLATGLGERGILAQKTVAGMHGIAAGALSRRHHGLDVEIGPRAAARDLERLVGDTHMQRQRVVCRVDRYRRDAGIGRRARDADGDLAAIGYQEFLERHDVSHSDCGGQIWIEVLLLHLARRRQGQSFDDANLRDLVDGHALGAPGTQALCRDGTDRLRLELDIGHRHLPLVGIVASDHARAQHLRMLTQQRLDLRREDAHALDLQHLLAAAEEVQEAVLVDAADVAGAQPAIDERLRGRLRLVPVALEQRRRPHPDLAFRTERQQRAGLEIGDLELGAGDRQADEDRLVVQIEIVVLEA
ncbi:hypothetical protein AB7M41_000370 [Bradyrhizobium diazoefficiens]